MAAPARLTREAHVLLALVGGAILQLVRIQSLLQTGFGGEKCTGIKPEAIFEGGMERTHSGLNQQQSGKSMHE